MAIISSNISSVHFLFLIFSLNLYFNLCMCPTRVGYLVPGLAVVALNPVRVQRSLPASYSPRTMEKMAM